MKFSCANLVIGFLLVGSGRCYSQGFMNLNFESGSTSGLSGGYIPTTSAFPDWSAFYGPPGNPTQANTPIVAYDTTTLGSALVILLDSNSPSGIPTPIQGNYSALLEGSAAIEASTASLGQTGTIPSTAQSLVFWANIAGSLDVSFDGQVLSLVDVSNAVNYTVYAANIAPFAGEMGQLLFTAPVQTETELDNIQFSTSPIPEPSEAALLSSASVLFAWQRRKKLLA
jgi:hypothetical protein